MKKTNATDAARIELLLAELRLPAMKLMWADLAARADKEGWPASRFLAALAEHEIADRGRRRIERHLAGAKLPTGKTFDTFDFNAVPMVSKAQVMALAAGDSWLNQGANVMLFGPPGGGKSHLAAALGLALVQNGRRVLFIRTTDLVQRLQVARRDLELEAAWKDAGLRIPLVAIPGDERPGLAIARYLRGLGVAQQQVTVIVPTPADEPFLARLRRMHAWSGLAESLRDLPNVGVVIVRAHGDPADPAHHHRMQLSPRRRHVALILVEDLDRAVLKAARYARGIEALEVRAVHAASDPDRANMLIDQWIAFGYLAGIPLDVEECNDRNIERSLRRYVSRLKDEATEVTLILPRRHFPKRRHLLLHDRTSRRIAGAFADVPHVDVVVVPYHLGADREHRAHDLEPVAAHR